MVILGGNGGVLLGRELKKNKERKEGQKGEEERRNKPFSRPSPQLPHWGNQHAISSAQVSIPGVGEIRYRPGITYRPNVRPRVTFQVYGSNATLSYQIRLRDAWRQGNLFQNAGAFNTVHPHLPTFFNTF
jgi:hypothetical protein